MVHAFDNYNALLSEGAPLAAVAGSVPGNSQWTRVCTDSPPPLPQNVAGLRPARVPASPGAPARRTRRVMVEGATLYLSEKDLARIIA